MNTKVLLLNLAKVIISNSYVNFFVGGIIMKINIKMALVAGVISVSILAGGLPAEAHPGSKDNTTKVTTEKKSLQERIHESISK